MCADLPNTGRKTVLIARLAPKSEDSEVTSTEESSEDSDSDRAPQKAYCGVSHSRGNCKKLVRKRGDHCCQHRAQDSPPQGERGARTPKVSSADSPPQGEPQGRGARTPKVSSARISPPSPKKHCPAPATLAATLHDLEGLKKVMEATQGFHDREPSTAKPVDGHDVHKMHIEMLKALGVNNRPMVLNMGGAGVPSGGQHMAMAAPDMQRWGTSATATHSLTSALEHFGLQRHEKRFREEGLIEADDILQCSVEELDALGLTSFEKRRVLRKMQQLKATEE
jgi:hypothetical protein